MPIFRKRPVEIEARQFLGQANADSIARWSGASANYLGDDKDDVVLHIHTLEGVMEARFGDWIIQGVNGEFYPCKGDIFVKTYEFVKGAS